MATTSYKGYRFFVGNLELPYAPSELEVTIGSNNKTVELINGSEINILKDPKLTEISFDIELPRGRQYPFANTLVEPSIYTDYFEKLMLEKKPTKLTITRPNPFYKKETRIGSTNTKQYTTIKQFESTVLKVSLEGYTMKESAENAYDVTVSLNFKEYLKYGTVKKIVNNNKNSNVIKKNLGSTTKKVTKNKTHKVKSGDTLRKISKKYYGETSKWKTIYTTNKNVIEKAAKKHGRKSSSNGHWIYPGTKLTIPKNT